jgi:TP901 family phage tail tape measure protein
MIRTQDNASRALSKITSEMKRAQSAADASELRARAAALRAQAQQMKIAGATRAQIDAINAQAKALKVQAEEAEKTTRANDRMASSLHAASSVMTDAGLALGAAGVIAAVGLKQAVDVAAEYERQVHLTFTQVDKRFKPSLEQLGDIGRRVARDIAVPFEQIQPALFEVFSSTEANIEQAEALLRSFSKAAVAGQTDIQTASRATIGIMNAFSLPFEDVNRILDVQFQLVQEGVGTYEEWAQRIGLVTPSAVRAGQSVETMAAALATSTRLGVSAARAGTSVARAFDALSNPKTIDKLKELGVEVLDTNGKFRPLVDIMGEWKGALDKLPPSERVAALLDTLKGAGSTIEARRFLQNILLAEGGLETLMEITSEFQNGAGAFQDAYSTMADTTASKSEILRNNFMLFKEAIGSALMPTFERLLEIGTELLNWFNDLPKGTQETIAQWALWGSVGLILAGALALVVGFVLAFMAAAAAAGVALAPLIGYILAGVVGLGALGTALYNAWTRSETFRNSVKSVWETLQGWWSQITGLIIPMLQSLGQQIYENIVVRLIEGARIVRDVLSTAWNMAAGIVNNVVIPAIAWLTRTYQENKSTIDMVLNIMGQLMKVILIVAAVVIGVLIVALAAVIAIMVGAFAAAWWVAINVIKATGATISWMYGIISGFIGWIGRAGAAIASWVANAYREIVSLQAKIISFFAGAGAWLYNAGGDIVRGLVNGIRGMIGAAASAAAEMASAALNAAKAAVGAKSPARKFITLGRNTAEGFIIGYTKTMGNAIPSMSQMYPTPYDPYAVGNAYGASQGRVGFGAEHGVASNVTNVKNNQIDITVNTNEIKPEKAAADLGWELEGRLS